MNYTNKRIRNVSGNVHLRDLRDISLEEYNKAVKVCKKISAIVEHRNEYIRKNDIDEKFAIPDRNWKMNNEREINTPYDLVVKPQYDIINRLRFFVQDFSGYQLMSFSKSSGKEHITKIPDNYSNNLDELLLRQDEFVRAFINITRYMPDQIIARPPKILGEIGWNIEGSVVNHDVFVYQERLNLLYETGIINWLKSKVKNKKKVNIVEIGGGYGALAYFLKKIIPEANYIIIDIPESLLFSALYLSLTCPDYNQYIHDGVDKSMLNNSKYDYCLIPNFLFDDLVKSNLQVDLAINTLSFAEMSEKQVSYYAEGLSKLLGDNGILFEQNYYLESTNMSCNCKDILVGKFSRKDIRVKDLITLNAFNSGIPHLWANRKLTDILDESFKPFNFHDWQWYLRFKATKLFLVKVLKKIFTFMG